MLEKAHAHQREFEGHIVLLQEGVKLLQRIVLVAAVREKQFHHGDSCSTSKVSVRGGIHDQQGVLGLAWRRRSVFLKGSLRIHRVRGRHGRGGSPRRSLPLRQLSGLAEATVCCANSISLANFLGWLCTQEQRNELVLRLQQVILLAEGFEISDGHDGRSAKTHLGARTQRYTCQAITRNEYTIECCM